MLKGFKTIAFGLLVAVGGTATAYLEDIKATLGECATNPLTNETICSLPGWTSLVIGGVIIALRFVTNTSVGKKE